MTQTDFFEEEAQAEEDNSGFVNGLLAGLGDVCRTNHRNNPESEAANASITPLKEAIRERIWQYLNEVGGAISDEVEVALGLPHQTASARLTELCALGRAYRSSLRRPTRSGRMAAVICVI